LSGTGSFLQHFISPTLLPELAAYFQTARLSLAGVASQLAALHLISEPLRFVRMEEESIFQFQYESKNDTFVAKMNECLQTEESY